MTAPFRPPRRQSLSSFEAALSGSPLQRVITSEERRQSENGTAASPGAKSELRKQQQEFTEWEAYVVAQAQAAAQAVQRVQSPPGVQWADRSPLDEAELRRQRQLARMNARSDSFTSSVSSPTLAASPQIIDYGSAARRSREASITSVGSSSSDTSLGTPLAPSTSPPTASRPRPSFLETYGLVMEDDEEDEEDEEEEVGNGERSEVSRETRQKQKNKRFARNLVLSTRQLSPKGRRSSSSTTNSNDGPLFGSRLLNRTRSPSSIASSDNNKSNAVAPSPHVKPPQSILKKQATSSGSGGATAASLDDSDDDDENDDVIDETDNVDPERRVRRPKIPSIFSYSSSIDATSPTPKAPVPSLPQGRSSYESEMQGRSSTSREFDEDASSASHYSVVHSDAAGTEDIGNEDVTSAFRESKAAKTDIAGSRSSHQAELSDAASIAPTHLSSSTTATGTTAMTPSTTMTNESRLSDDHSDEDANKSWESGSGKASGGPPLKLATTATAARPDATAPPLPQRKSSQPLPLAQAPRQVGGSAPPPLPQRPSSTNVGSISSGSSRATLTTVPPTASAAQTLPSQGLLSAEEKKRQKAVEKAEKKRIEASQHRHAVQRKILMKSYEELEVERFLHDFGQNVDQVVSLGQLPSQSLDGIDAAVKWPNRVDYLDSGTGKINTVAYGLACLASVAQHLSPTRLFAVHSSGSSGEDLQQQIVTSNDDEVKFSLVALKANGARLYMTTIPLYEGLWAAMRSIWRWDSKVMTTLSCFVYFTLWYRGFLIPGFLGLLICYILKLRAFPPKPEVLREMLKRQRRRAEELDQARKAKMDDILREAQQQQTSAFSETASLFFGEKEEESEQQQQQAKKKSKYSLAADATRRYGSGATQVTSSLADVHERFKNFALWRNPPATWRALFLLGVGMLATLFSTPWIVARTPGLVLGGLFFILAPIVEHRPEWLGVEWKNPFDFLLAGVPNDAQYAMEVLRRRAALGQRLTGDEDLAKAYTLEGNTDSSETEQEEEAEGGKLSEGDEATATSTAVSARSGDSVVKPTGAAAGASIDSSATADSKKIDWAKWRSRAVKGRDLAVAGSEMLSGQRAIQLPRMAPSSSAQPTTSSRLVDGISAGVNWSFAQLEGHSQRIAIDRKLAGLDDESAVSPTEGQLAAGDSLSRLTTKFSRGGRANEQAIYWAVYKGTFGHVVVLPEKIFFRSLFAVNPKKGGGLDKEVPLLEPAAPADGEQTDGDGDTNGIEGDEAMSIVKASDPALLKTSKVRIIVEVRLENVVGLKKTRNKTTSRFNLLVGGNGRFGPEGLEVKVSNNKSSSSTTAAAAAGSSNDASDKLVFSSVVGRDECFNRILGLAPQRWSKV